MLRSNYRNAVKPLFFAGFGLAVIALCFGCHQSGATPSRVAPPSEFERAARTMDEESPDYVQVEKDVVALTANASEEAIARALASPKASVRQLAIDVVARRKNLRFVEKIEKMAAEDTDVVNRASALLALGTMESRSSIPFLEAMLEDYITCAASADSLAKLHSAGSVDKIAKLLKYSGTRQQTAAIDALAKLGTKHAREILVAFQQELARAPTKDVQKNVVLREALTRALSENQPK